MVDKINVIKKKLESQENSLNNIKLKQELATLLAKDNEFEEALNTITESLNIAQKNNLPKEVNKSLKILIKILQIKNDLSLSQKIAKEAIKFFRNYSDYPSLVLILNHLVQISYLKKNYKYTLKAITELIQIIEKEFPEKDKEVVKLLFQKSDIEKELGYYDASNRTIEKAIELSKEKEDISNIGIGYSLIGSNFILLENYEKAMSNFLEAINFLKQSQNNTFLADTYLHMAEISIKKNEFAQAMIYFDQAIYLKRENKNLLGIGEARLSLANLFKEKKKINEAIDFYRKAGNLFEVLGAKEQLIECYKSLAEMYNSLGDEKLAFSYLSKHHSLSTEFIRKQSEEKKELLQKNNEIEILRLNKIIKKKLKEIKELKNIIENDKNTIESLEQKVDEIEIQYSEEKKLLLNSYDEIDKLKTEIIDADLIITEKTNQIKDLEIQIKELKKNIEKLEKKSSEQEKQISHYQEELNNLQNELNDNLELIEEKNNLLKENKEKIAYLNSLIDRSKVSESKMEDRLRSLEKELENKISELEKNEKIFAETKKELENLKKENTELSDNLLKSNEKIQQLNKEIEEFNLLKSQKDDKDKEILRENEKLKEIIKEKNEEIQINNELLNELENDKTLLENKIEDLKKLKGKEFSETKNQLQSLKDQVAGKEGLIEQLNLRINKLRLENNKLLEDLEEKNKLITDYKESSERQLKTKIDSIKKHYEKLLSDLEKEKNSQKKKIESEILKKDEEIKNLNYRIQEIKDKYDYSIKKSNSDKDKSIKELKEKVEEFKIKNKELLNHTDVLASEIADLRNQLQKYKNDIQSLNREKEDLSKKSDSNNYEERIKKLKESLNSANAEISKLKSQLKQKEVEFDKSQKEMKSYQTLIAELQENHKSKISEIKKNNQIKMNDNLEKLTNKITTQINIIQSLRESKDQIISERDKLNLELSRLKKRLTATENKLKEFTSNSKGDEEFSKGFSPEEYEEIIKERDMTATLLRRSIQNKTNEIAKLQEQIDSFEQKKFELEEKLNSKLIEIEKLKNDNENYKNKFDEINSKLIGYEKIVQEYHSKNSEDKINQKKYDEEINNLQKINRNLRESNKEFRKKIEESNEFNSLNLSKIGDMLGFAKNTLSLMNANIYYPLKKIRPIIDKLFSDDITEIEKEVYLKEFKNNIDNIENFFPKLISDRANFSIKQTVNFAYIEVQEIIEKFEPHFQEILEKKNQYWKLVLPKEPLIIFADPIKLFEVLFNLISNASKFSAKGSNILMIVEKIVYSKNKKVCRFSIIDNGIGISQEKLKTIYEPSLPNKYVGNNGEVSSGIGLFVVKAIVEQMHGKINLVSTLNLGTTVTVEFPLQKRT